jgi:hypothetical protein
VPAHANAAALAVQGAIDRNETGVHVLAREALAQCSEAGIDEDPQLPAAEDAVVATFA